MLLHSFEKRLPKSELYVVISVLIFERGGIPYSSVFAAFSFKKSNSLGNIITIVTILMF
jgi:hypothetical protein